MRIIALTIWLLFSGSLYAHHLDHNQALHMRQRGEILPAQQLLEQAFARHPDSRLLEMKLKRKHGRHLYKLQLLNRDGRVHRLYMDASTGELIREKIYED